jgi:hypothetical protein
MVPDQIFIVANKTGGQVMTAYHGDTPVGFTLAFAAMREEFGRSAGTSRGRRRKFKQRLASNF